LTGTCPLRELTTLSRYTGDPADLARVARAAYAVYIPRMGQRPEPMDLDYEQVVATSQVLTRSVDGQLVAFVTYSLDPVADRVKIHNIAVLPSQQGRGLGSELLAEAEAEAYAAGVGYSDLYTNAAMTENLAFYARRGYEEFHRTDVRGYHRVFLRKTLEPPAA
jgi:ribosomal protein S18 acetylase RimI-like enzyme